MPQFQSTHLALINKADHSSVKLVKVLTTLLEESVLEFPQSQAIKVIQASVQILHSF